MKIFLILVLLSLSGCSVAMAAKKKGVDAEDIMACRVRTCFMALKDTEVMEEEKHEDGSKMIIYKSLMKQGSAGRAAMHGVLDVLTLGIWEVAGTPIEGSKGKDRFYITRVDFDEDGGVITASIEGAS